MTPSDRLNALLRSRGLNAFAVVRLMQEQGVVGTSYTNLGQVVKGKRGLSARTAGAVAAVLGVDPASILYGDTAPTKELPARTIAAVEERIATIEAAILDIRELLKGQP